MSHILDLQFLFILEFPLVQPAELIDLVLILASDFGLLANSLLVLFRKLQRR